VRFCVSEQDAESDSSVDSSSDGELNKLIQDASKKMRCAGEGGPSYASVEKVRDVENDDDGDYNYRVSESVGEGRGRGSAAEPPTTKTYFATRNSGFKHIFWTSRAQKWLVQIPGVRTERTAFLDDAKRKVARYKPLSPNRETRKRQGGHRGHRGERRDALLLKDEVSSTDKDGGSKKCASAGLKKAAGASAGSPTKDLRLQSQSFSASLPPETGSEVQVLQTGAVTHQGACRMCLAHVQTHDIRDQSSPLRHCALSF